MKKNRWLRASGVMLALCLLSTGLMWGSYAKYVTSDAAEDAARVAKWGVSISASGNLFGGNYQKNSAENKPDEIIAEAVGSVDTAGAVKFGEKDVADIVAPGTKNSEGISIGVTGTPEVAVKLSVAAPDGVEISDILLNEGTYGIMRAVEKSEVNAENCARYFVIVHDDETDTDSFKAAEDAESDKYFEKVNDVTVAGGAYYPLVYKLSIGSETTEESKLQDILDKIAEDLGTENGSVNVKANELADASYSVTWEWPFEREDDDEFVIKTKEGVNNADTILGTLMANPDNDGDVVVVEAGADESFMAISEANYSLKAEFGIGIAVEQAD